MAFSILLHCTFINKLTGNYLLLPINYQIQLPMYLLSKTHPQKRAFITGAASGLGKAFCIELAKDGWTIGIADINLRDLAVTAEEITPVFSAGCSR